MKTLTLKIKDVKALNDIQKALSANKQLSDKERNTLADFLLQLPATTDLLEEKIEFDDSFEIRVLDTGKIAGVLEQYQNLFDIELGEWYSTSCRIIDKDNIKHLRQGVVLNVWFAPSISYNESTDVPFEIYLNDDCSATFHLPTLEDAEQYPELYQFKGTWKEAYLLMVSTIQKGWPMEEFPEELQKFLPLK